MLNYIQNVLENMPEGWVQITTHRLDIYEETLAKAQFLEQFESLFAKNDYTTSSLSELPTAYDYIRLGHPLSCILEWAIAKSNNIDSDKVISFSSKTTPILAILRTNHLKREDTLINYIGELPDGFNLDLVRDVYGYKFELNKVRSITDVPKYKGSNIFISNHDKIEVASLDPKIDFYIHTYTNLGSTIIVNGDSVENSISEIQHVRRRETIAMTPIDTLNVLNSMVTDSIFKIEDRNFISNKSLVIDSIFDITGAKTDALVASSGLSIQYAIMMGLIQDAVENHKGKSIKIIVPPNSYGGTNDQARRIAVCIANVEVLDLPVDGGNDMTKSIDNVLNKLASEDAIPYIIAEIPTNPRVEVPDLQKLKEVLSKRRKTMDGRDAIDPIFILDQTFCPNVHFLNDDDILSTVKTISYVSGSKFPSGGLVTAGYCVANKKAAHLMKNIEKNLILCDNEATDFQYKTLATQLPSMNQRIIDAYKNTREYVSYIQEVLPKAKINFVTEELAKKGFTPSVFSIDLPTHGTCPEEMEANKRTSNLKLIHKMITEIPHESKFCVSYGQLKGVYWTVPATSTQGTTKEGDKDYIVRVSISPDADLVHHKKVFLDFVKEI